MEFQRLTYEIVVRLHDLILEKSYGLRGHDEHKIRSILTRVEQYNHYSEINDTFKIAALYAIHIATGHGFVDCNKRTALGCLYLFLNINGYDFAPNNEDAANLMERIADSTKEVPEKEVIDFIKNNTSPIKNSSAFFSH